MKKRMYKFDFFATSHMPFFLVLLLFAGGTISNSLNVATTLSCIFLTFQYSIQSEQESPIIKLQSETDCYTNGQSIKLCISAEPDEEDKVEGFLIQVKEFDTNGEHKNYENFKVGGEGIGEEKLLKCHVNQKSPISQAEKFDFRDVEVIWIAPKYFKGDLVFTALVDMKIRTVHTLKIPFCKPTNSANVSKLDNLEKTRFLNSGISTEEFEFNLEKNNSLKDHDLNNSVILVEQNKMKNPKENINLKEDINSKEDKNSKEDLNLKEDIDLKKDINSKEDIYLKDDINSEISLDNKLITNEIKNDDQKLGTFDKLKNFELSGLFENQVVQADNNITKMSNEMENLNNDNDYDSYDENAENLNEAKKVNNQNQLLNTSKQDNSTKKIIDVKKTNISEKITGIPEKFIQPKNMSHDLKESGDFIQKIANKLLNEDFLEDQTLPKKTFVTNGPSVPEKNQIFELPDDLEESGDFADIKMTDILKEPVNLNNQDKTSYSHITENHNNLEKEKETMNTDNQKFPKQQVTVDQTLPDIIKDSRNLNNGEMAKNQLQPFISESSSILKEPNEPKEANNSGELEGLDNLYGDDGSSDANEPERSMDATGTEELNNPNQDIKPKNSNNTKQPNFSYDTNITDNANVVEIPKFPKYLKLPNTLDASNHQINHDSSVGREEEKRKNQYFPLDENHPDNSGDEFNEVSKIPISDETDDGLLVEEKINKPDLSGKENKMASPEGENGTIFEGYNGGIHIKRADCIVNLVLVIFSMILTCSFF